jgi:hypothetical protein
LISTQGPKTFISNFNGLDELVNMERIATDNGHLALDMLVMLVKLIVYIKQR